MDSNKTIKIVREAYGSIAKQQDGCGCGCGCSYSSGAGDYVKSLGYTEDELKAIPAEANLALSCGNPTALASLKPGETVLDLGSGAGFDCFLASSKVGAGGKVIGVDMTPEMIERAREITAKDGFENVEFRLGEIENLPVEDNSVDVVISNCVINLSANKARVFSEIYRVLKPGGRVAISDVSLLKGLPESFQSNIQAYVSCIAGAVSIEEYSKLVSESGLRNINIKQSGNSFAVDPDTKDPVVKAALDALGEGESISDYVASVYVEGIK